MGGNSVVKQRVRKYLKDIISVILSVFIICMMSISSLGYVHADDKKITIALDAGHGGSDSGAVNTYQNKTYKESEMTLKIAKNVKEILEGTGRFNIIMTRSDNTYKSLSLRVEVAAKSKVDALISLHINSSDNESANGAEVEIPNDSYRPAFHTAGKNLANKILDHIQKLGVKKRGAFTRNSGTGAKYSDGSISDYYAIVRQSKQDNFLGIIVEHAFISNTSDLTKYLSTDTQLEALAEADALGIMDYYGVKENADQLLKDKENQYALVYDYNYYVNKYADVKKQYSSNRQGALDHFLSTGMKEGRQGNSSFDVNSYRMQYADLRQKYGDSLKDYYDHYIKEGYSQGRQATGTTVLQNPVTELNGVDYSSVYDFNYYYNHYDDVKKKYSSNDDVGVLQHFVNTGMKEGRQANSSFDVSSFRMQHEPLRRIYGDNWPSYYTEYMRYGSVQDKQYINTTEIQDPITTYDGVDYSAVYDYHYYLNKYPELKTKYSKYDDLGVLKNFVEEGIKAGRQGNSDFNLAVYKANYPNLVKQYGNDNTKYYQHYITTGKANGYNAKTLFSQNTNQVTNNISSQEVAEALKANQYAIMGKPLATEKQLVSYFQSKADFPDYYKNHDTEVKTLEDFVHIYYQEAVAENVRPEVAFAQMIIETGWLKYGGRVKIEQYNFAGLGATDGSSNSGSFASVRLGIRAHIQHLKAYADRNATESALKYPLIDNRFKYVTKGSAQYVEWLGTKENPNGLGWATSANYGNNVRTQINAILKS